MKISKDHRESIRFFAFFLANGTLAAGSEDDELLDNIDYSSLLEWPSGLEQIFALYCNCLETNDEGREVGVNANFRVAQWIRQHFDTGYKVIPPFTEEELELH